MQKHCYCLIFILSLTCKTLSVNNEIMQNYLENVLAKVAPNRQLNYLFWLQRPKQTNSYQFAKYAQVLWLQNGTEFKETKQAILNLHVKHSLTVILMDRVLKLSRLVRLIKNLQHVMVLINSKKPPKEILLRINSPIIWIQSQPDRVFTKVILLCPVVGKPALPTDQLIAVCTRIKGCLYSGALNVHHQPNNIGCTNPLKGQAVTLEEIPVVPIVLPPKYTGGKVSSYGVNLFLMYAKKYEFIPQIKFSTAVGRFMPHNNSFTPGSAKNIRTGETNVMSGGISDKAKFFFELGSPLWHVQEKYVTRKPQPLKPLFNVTRPFSVVVWVFLAITLAALASTFIVFNKIYTNVVHLKKQGLSKAEESEYLFFLYVFTRIVEPDTLSWFHKWSAGRFLTLIYYTMSTLLVIAYACNLRAYMTTIQYESPPQGRSDLVVLGKTVYIPHENFKQRNKKDILSYLEENGLQNSIRYQLAKLAKKTNGYFSYVTEGKIPQRAVKNIIENGAALLIDEYGVQYFYKKEPLMDIQNIYIIPELAGDYYACHVYTKNSPATNYFNIVARRALENGLMNYWLYQHLPMRSVIKVPPPKAIHS